MKKRILIALPTDCLGGAEQYLKNIAVFFLKKEYMVTVLFLKSKKSGGWKNLKTKNNIKLIFTSSSSELKGIIPFFKNLISLRKERFDFIFTSHVHITGVLGLFVKLNIIKKTFFIGRESTSIFKRFNGLKLILFKTYYFLGYSSIDLLVCQTDIMKTQLIEALPWLSKKTSIQVIPNPVNFNDISFNEKIDRKFGKFIVAAGRLIHLKGFDLLIKAFKIIKNKYPSLKLVILGEGSSRSKLERLILDLNLECDVFLEGFVENVYPYFNKSILCVVSSRIEGFPNVLLQMMSQNTKVVSTLCAGGIEDIKGISIAETNNVISLANAIENTLKQNSVENRVIFDNNLAERSIGKFIQKIELHLNGHK
jgi:glycosyltransferase involved in cell wall biosynthesis